MRKSNNLVYTLWIPRISWTRCSNFHEFHGQALYSTIFVETLQWFPLYSGKPASSAVNVHFFRGIQKSFPRTRTTTATNKPFLWPRHRSLALKNAQFLIHWMPETLWKVCHFHCKVELPTMCWGILKKRQLFHVIIFKETSFHSKALINGSFFLKRSLVLQFFKIIESDHL